MVHLAVGTPWAPDRTDRFLKPGESRTVTIALPRSSFETWDAQTNTMRIVPGQYELMVGSSSADKDLKTITTTLK